MAGDGRKETMDVRDTAEIKRSQKLTGERVESSEGFTDDWSFHNGYLRVYATKNRISDVREKSYVGR